MIHLSEISYSYDSGRKFNFPAVSVSSAAPLLILGKSGVGKSTLLHILALLQKPTNGTYLFDNEQLFSLSPKQTNAFRAQHIGIVFQKPHIIKSLNVYENLELSAYLAGNKIDKDYTNHILTYLGIQQLVLQKATTLSLGESQRLNIARALINKPKLILADEPSSSLDDENCLAMVKLLKELAAQSQASLVIVTHDQRLKNEFANQIILS